MRLVRFAIVTFYGQSSIPSGATQLGSVEVEMSQGKSPSDKDQLFLFTAKVELEDRPIKDESNRVDIPIKPRELCEFAIEGFANIISAFYGSSRSILSPVPCVALECGTTEEREYLEESRGILALHKGDSGVRTAIPLEPEFLAAVADRLDGVALLAEAYSGGEVGRYREFTRFFELAFRGTITQINKKLCQFLDPTPFGYTRAEIDNWIDLRHPLSHADMKKAQGIAIASDIRPYVLRMEQAALDVLFNKSNWGDRSKTRRKVWVPDACTTSQKGDVVVKQGSKLSLLFRTYDEFGIYPRTLGVQINKIEESWYMKLNDDNTPKAQPNKALQSDRSNRYASETAADARRYD